MSKIRSWTVEILAVHASTVMYTRAHWPNVVLTDLIVVIVIVVIVVAVLVAEEFAIFKK